MNFQSHSLIETCNSQCSFCFLQFTDILCTENLFLGVAKQEIGEIIKTVHHQVRSFSQGDILMHENDDYTSLLFLLHGKVSTQIMSVEGQILIMEQLHAPATLVPAALFASENKVFVTIVADEDCKVLILPRESMLQIIAKDERIMENFLKILSNRVQFLTKKLKLMCFENLRTKFLKHILELKEIQKSSTITLQHTQQELSEIFGVARPSLARVIRELHNEGVIHAKGKTITILDVK